MAAKPWDKANSKKKEAKKTPHARAEGGRQARREDGRPALSKPRRQHERREESEEEKG